MARTFAEGDPVIFFDRKGRKKYAWLRAGKRTNSRGSLLEHDAVIGQADGAPLTSHKGEPFRAYSATYRDHVLHMPRHAQIVYPKDAALITLWADVRPGATVVEGGLGSGALTMALLRAVGPTGRVVTYERHAEPANRALKNIAALMGDTPNHEVRIADLYEGLAEREVDRVVLDVPEPWEAAPRVHDALRLGGLLAAYVPTVIQMQRLALALAGWDRWIDVEFLEVMLRRWHVTYKSVRPDHKMVGHTGFLAVARKNPGVSDAREGAAAQDDEDDAEITPL